MTDVIVVDELYIEILSKKSGNTLVTEDILTKGLLDII